MTAIKNYKPSKANVQAIKIGNDTVEEAAKWCGGEVRKRSVSPSIDYAYDRVLVIPTLDGPSEASFGDYLVRTPDGKFSQWPKAKFEEEYSQYGLRQDGININDTTFNTAFRGGRTIGEVPPGVLVNGESEAEYRTRMGW